MAQAFARVSLDTAAAQSYAQALLKAPQIVQEELSAALTEAMLLIERETKDRAPVGVTQALRGSIASELRGSTPTELEGVVFSPMPYAAAVELGTRPHYPPLEPLMDWVAAKLGVGGDEIEAVARAVQRKIGTQGTKPKRAFTGALEDNERQLNSILGAAIARINQRLAGLSS